MALTKFPHPKRTNKTETCLGVDTFVSTRGATCRFEIKKVGTSRPEAASRRSLQAAAPSRSHLRRRQQHLALKIRSFVDELSIFATDLTATFSCVVNLPLTRRVHHRFSSFIMIYFYARLGLENARVFFFIGPSKIYFSFLTALPRGLVIFTLILMLENENMWFYWAFSIKR